ncbi:MAG: phytoene desaturase family protein, partial [Hyphomicrobiaceae bacterium]
MNERTSASTGASPPHDVAIVGGGHNALVAAFYLARAGLDVVVLEKNPVVGGAAVTEEFHPGFRNSVASYTVSLLSPRVIADMQLARHGLEVLERPAANFWPIDEKHGLLMPFGIAARQAAIAPFSARDAAALPGYEAALDRAAGVLRDLMDEAPPNAGGGLIEALRAGRVGRHLARRPLADQRLLAELMTTSA